MKNLKFYDINIIEAIKLFELHIIILLLYSTKKVVNPANKLELKKAVNPAIELEVEKAVFPANKLELEKERLETKL